MRDDSPRMFPERRTVQRKQLDNGAVLSWTLVEELDGQGVVFRRRRELFTLNYKSITDAQGERLLQSG
jgi:hypothetical protein